MLAGELYDPLDPELAQERARRQGFALLGRAATAGHFRIAANLSHADKDPDLAFLRDRPDYRRFRAALKAGKLPAMLRR